MLSERLAERRLKKKLTHQNIADKLGITRQAYGNYESGKRDIDTETLSKIADMLDTTTDYLLGRTANPSSNKLKYEETSFEAFVNNPNHGIFFKEYLDAPEERKNELMQFWRIIQEAERGRKLGDRQGE